MKKEETERKMVVAVFDSMAKLIFPNADIDTRIECGSIIITAKEKKHCYSKLVGVKEKKE